MLLLLGAGILLGPSVAGIVQVPPDSPGEQALFSLGVALIIFQGGLQVSLTVLRGVATSLVLLVVPGVVLTAAITGAAAAAAFHLPAMTGALIGAALAPTDPAILVPLFARLRLRPRVAQTVIAESALNDPTGAVLTLAILAMVSSGRASLSAPLEDFVTQLAISTVVGIAFGLLLAVVVSSRRSGVWRESAAIMALAIVAVSFLSTRSIGGSGYLGAFFAGLIAGNTRSLGLPMHPEHETEMRALVRVGADIAVMFLFLLLGVNLPLGALGAQFGPALAVVAALILVARPACVLACVLPDRRARWSGGEIAFLAWTRETGVMPVALAGIVLAHHAAGAGVLTICVALAVVLTLGLQATTKPWLARRLHLLGPAPPVVASRVPA
jgi:cell volume regulation protein A